MTLIADLHSLSPIVPILLGAVVGAFISWAGWYLSKDAGYATVLFFFTVVFGCTTGDFHDDGFLWFGISFLVAYALVLPRWLWGLDQKRKSLKLNPFRVTNEDLW
jgi:hypothetical protein